ncbi:Uncharacterized protein OS=Ktedonobacter racemifer DSM 44963 GN=Krac_2879 PE=4 SV=1 [Gemmata massiliana]|uniref:Uncharacterized protein n=1 Tax=Gemmata massiliana TaxID=1210884 RepID=A0A6P2D7C1_9BACT|nr:hypothetical protein [Gemmata massiliana]VTR95340.1 Uncharacterized protein OS=Ktedonobacter racemifer DSM 44963 GN=Krac_2879 PE=4 SV=1 [Gemmata massiliana]
MIDRAAILDAFAKYTQKLATKHDVHSEPAEVFGGPPFSTLMQFTQTLGSRAELNALLAELVPFIRAADPFRGSTVALNCGTLVEIGGDPGLVFPHLLGELPRHLDLAKRAHEKDIAPRALFDEDPDAAKSAGGLRYLLLATMTVICRSAEFRQALRADAEIVENIFALREHYGEADFVAQVLNLADGLDLLVLAPQERKGFRLALEAVSTNAHLFTLIQGALIGGGHLAGDPIDPEVMAVATGESPHPRLLSDHARFHFDIWSGSVDNPIGTLLSLPVEESPLSIPSLDGQRIVVIGPSILGGRGWDSNFFANIHDALKSRAEVVEVLPEAEVTRWLERIASAKT